MTGSRGTPIQNAVFFVAMMALIALAISTALFLKAPAREEKTDPPVPSPPTVVVIVVNADGTVRSTAPTTPTTVAR